MIVEELYQVSGRVKEVEGQAAHTDGANRRLVRESWQDVYDMLETIDNDLGAFRQSSGQTRSQ